MLQITCEFNVSSFVFRRRLAGSSPEEPYQHLSKWSSLQMSEIDLQKEGSSMDQHFTSDPGPPTSLKAFQFFSKL